MYCTCNISHSTGYTASEVLEEHMYRVNCLIKGKSIAASAHECSAETPSHWGKCLTKTRQCENSFTQAWYVELYVQSKLTLKMPNPTDIRRL